jgi:hypothetical protein
MAVEFVRLSVLVVAMLISVAGVSHAYAEETAVADAAADVAVDNEADAANSAEDSTATESEAADKEETQDTGEQPTHKQSSLININAEGLSEATVHCFCLTADDALLAGCTGSANEIRVFNADGKYETSYKLPIAPEAINVAPDKTILVAGEGKLMRLSADGEPMAEVESPHAAAIRESEAEVRKEVIEQHEQQKQMLPQMLEAYDNAIKEMEKQIKALEEQENAEEEIAAAKEMIETYESTKKQVAEQYGGEAAEKDLTEEQIADMVKSSMQYKVKTASISSDGEAVFIATGMPAGYGYSVWRMTPEFTEGKVIVSGLSGCCGQMDVQANDEGVFVAENSRKRVRRFNAEGKSVCDWGKSSEDVDGFGSCCNPMNLAFGRDGSVYTAEDTTGRIKRYSVEGALLSVIGAADVVPGCKKVSIGVDAKGDRVYMLDITRNTVAVLSRVAPDPAKPLASAKETSSQGFGLLRLLGLQ